jgi:hypothetical protein
MMARKSINHPEYFTTGQSVIPLVSVFFIKPRVFLLKASIGFLHHVDFNVFNLSQILFFFPCDGLDGISFGFI